MTHGASGQKGAALLYVVALLMLAALTVIVEMTGDLVARTSRRTSDIEVILTRIQKALVTFNSTHGRLPCPSPPPSAGYSNAGWPDNVNPPSGVPLASSSCVYQSTVPGVIPWKALGLSEEEVTDPWGRLISYRVYSGTHGLTQEGGGSAANCDTDNTPSSSDDPPDANGLCGSGTTHNMLRSSFITYSPDYDKGLKIAEFGVEVKNVAYVLISHGPSGHGGYTSSGERVDLPATTAKDYPNTQSAPTTFVRDTLTTSDVLPGTENHFDDYVAYLTISDLLKLSGRDARDWPDAAIPSFDATTTADLTSSGTSHFLSSGTSSDGRAFAAADSGTAVEVGSAFGSYASCLWWPQLINLTSGTKRYSLNLAVDFAANNPSTDRFAGFTLGYLSGLESAPTNSTCGLTAATEGTVLTRPTTTTITLSPSVVAQVAVNMEVFGSQISATRRVTAINAATSTITLNNTVSSSIVNTTVSFSSPQVREYIGWAGGTLASYTNRFAVEFDTRSDSAESDPSNPHLAVDYAGVKHDGTLAESCTQFGYGLPCDSQTTTNLTKAASYTSGNSTITVSNNTGLLLGMSVSGTGISGVYVTGISGTSVTLSSAPTSTQTSTTISFSLPYTASSYLMDGLTTFHTRRAEVRPLDCLETTGTGTASSTSISVASATGVRTGMSVYGNGVAPGATVASIAGTTLTVSTANTGTVSGTLFVGEGTPISTTATGTSGASTITVADATEIAIGHAVLGTGIGSGATVTSILSNVVSVSATNTGAVSGTVTFALPRTLVKAWTFSSNECSLFPTICTNLKNLAVSFTADLSSYAGARFAVSCVPAPTQGNAYNSLYFGITTANRSTATGTTLNLILKNLSSNIYLLP